jgi:hypothetical protein
MKQIQNYDKVTEAGEFKQLKPGIYPLVITDVKDNAEKEYLEIYYEIADGENKGYFAAAKEALGKDISKECRSYKESALPFFKAFIVAVEKSNQGYSFVKTWDESTLKGKYVIGVFGEEEYLDNDHNLKVICALQEFRSIPAFKEGKLKVPELKKLPEDQRPKEVVAGTAPINTATPDQAPANNAATIETPDLDKVEFPW